MTKELSIEFEVRACKFFKSEFQKLKKNTGPVHKFLFPRGVRGEDRSYQLLSYYVSFGSGSNKIVNGILVNGDLDFQIPSSSILYDNLKGCTALHVALRKKDYETFENLIRRGADFTIKNDGGVTVLHQIATSTIDEFIELEKFAHLVLSAHVSFNESTNPQDNNGVSHFHVACMTNHVAAARFFLAKRKSTIDQIVSSDSPDFAGYTPLHFAVKNCCPDTASLLLDRGVNVKLKNARGLSPLHLLIKRNIEIIDWKNTSKRIAWGPFKEELETNEKLIQMILKNYKADINGSLDETGLTVFHVACTLQGTSMVEELLKDCRNLEKSISFKSPLWPGYTALHFAAHCNPEIVLLLLKNQANYLAKDAAGVAPLDLCLQRYQIEYLHSFMSTSMSLKTIRFNDDASTTLLNAILAMKNTTTLNDFLQNAFDINSSIVDNSPLWPGYTLLHVVVLLAGKKENTLRFVPTRHDDPSISDGIFYNSREDDETIFHDRVKVCLNRGSNINIGDSFDMTPLHLAFKLCNETAVKYFLLECQENIVDSVDDTNLAHLHVACAAANKIAVEKLLSRNANVNRAVIKRYKYQTLNANETRIEFVISAGSTPLHIAVSNGSKEITDLLVNHGANIYARDCNGLTPIHQILARAMKDKSDGSNVHEIASVLLSSDKLKNSETSFWLSHLHVASYANNTAAIEKLLDGGANIDASISAKHLLGDDFNLLSEFDGFTPLTFALKYDRKDAIAALIHRGANIFQIPDRFKSKLLKDQSDFLASTLINELVCQEKIRQRVGLTWLHAACASLDVDRVKELLNQGANPNEQVQGNSPIWPGHTALHFLASVRAENYSSQTIESIANMLINFGADVTIQNADNLTAIHEGFYRCFEKSSLLPYIYSKSRWYAQYFCSSRTGINDNVATTKGATLFAKSFVGTLLREQRDFSMDPVSNEGWSHFHVACFLQEIPVVEQYLKYNVNVNQPVDYLFDIFGGFLPLHTAAFQHCDELVDLLLKHGADVHARNSHGYKPLHEAANLTFYSLSSTPYPPNNCVASLKKAGANPYAQTPKGETAFELHLRTKKVRAETCSECKKSVNLFNPVTGEGYIGLAVSHETNVDDLSQNSHFTAVINAPEKNGPDLNGRTPIHNVVTLITFRAVAYTPVEVYIHVIKCFMQKGFDLDHQDYIGRTALFKASEFGNSNALRALFELGSDINITDYTDVTPAKLLWINFENIYLQLKQKEIRRAYMNVFNHLYKLHYVGIYMNDNNVEAFESLKKHLNVSHDTKEELAAEVVKLKEKKIDSLQMVLWQFLPENGAIARYPKLLLWKRRMIDSFFNNDTSLRQEFPHFAGLLQLQHRKARKRIALLERAKISLRSLIRFDALPDICCDCVFLYLTNRDLNNIVQTETFKETRSSYLKSFKTYLNESLRRFSRHLLFYYIVTFSMLFMILLFFF